MSGFSLEKKSSNKVAGGYLNKYQFQSATLGGLPANFNLFIPKESLSGQAVPVLYFLAGLTCTEDNAAQKGGFFQTAAEEGIAIVFPDTSPRGAKVEGEDDGWDFGTGAGFYINATSEKFAKNYRMYDHIVKELPEVLKSVDGVALDLSRSSIFGHSMGGHGALTLYLLNTSTYRSCSAFSPITNPSNAECKWGQKAFKGYFAGGVEEGKQHDATILISQAKGKNLHILVDTGDADNFYKDKQLLPENFVTAARDAGFGEDQVNVRTQEGYDHSYYFISTFAPEHIRYHAKFLKS